ncbi:MAG TPA: excisionase family DNA-binding protein [Gaiellaceae bacterium]|jgi:excisionase family DNA binding protein
MTRAEAADYAGVSVRTIDRALAAGELHACRARRGVRIHVDALDAWLKRRGRARRPPA